MPMNAPGPIVQISPAVAQEVIALQAAELIRLRVELGNERSGGSRQGSHEAISLEQFNELRKDFLEAAFTPKESSDSLRTELVSISDRMRTMQSSLQELVSHMTHAPTRGFNGTQDGTPTRTTQTDFCASKKYVDELQQQLAVARDELVDAHGVMGRLEDERVKNEARVSDLVKQLFAAHVESSDLQELLKGAQEACSTSQSQASGMEVEMGFLREENGQLKRKIETLTVESNQRQLHLEQLNERFASTIAQHEEEVASLCMAVEVVKDASSRPGLLGTVRNKVAQVYKGVGGYLPQQPATNPADPADDREPPRTSVLVEEPQSDVNGEPSTTALQPGSESLVEDDATVGDSGSSTAGSMVSLTEFASSPALEESEHKVVRSDAPPGADASQSGERGPVSMTQTGSSGSGSRPAGEMIVAGPAQAKGRRIEDVLTPLPMKVITQAALDHLQRTCGFNHVLFVTASDFVPGESIEDSYFIKPSMVCHNGQWAPCKNKAFNKRIAKGQIDLIAHLGGAPYYLGTYIITDDPEPTTAEYFQGLPDVTQRCLVTATGPKNEAPDIMSRYQNGTLTALKYRARRVDLNRTLDQYLRSALGGAGRA